MSYQYDPTYEHTDPIFSWIFTFFQLVGKRDQYKSSVVLSWPFIVQYRPTSWINCTVLTFGCTVPPDYLNSPVSLLLSATWILWSAYYCQLPEFSGQLAIVSYLNSSVSLLLLPTWLLRSACYCQLPEFSGKLDIVSYLNSWVSLLLSATWILRSAYCCQQPLAHNPLSTVCLESAIWQHLTPVLLIHTYSEVQLEIVRYKPNSVRKTSIIVSFGTNPLN